MDEEFVLVAAPAWAGQIGPLTCDDQGPLRDAQLVAYAEDLPILCRYWRHVFLARLSARPAVVVPDLRGVRSSVAAGSGVTVLPRYLCEDDLASGTLLTLLSSEDPAINTGFLVQRTGAPPSRHTRAGMPPARRAITVTQPVSTYASCPGRAGGCGVRGRAPGARPCGVPARARILAEE
nr:LysR substrate-binding domain-containing protein [Nonomuraea terrae]